MKHLAKNVKVIVVAKLERRNYNVVILKNTVDTFYQIM